MGKRPLRTTTIDVVGAPDGFSLHGKLVGPILN
jgi:hypothetical protein